MKVFEILLLKNWKDKTVEYSSDFEMEKIVKKMGYKDVCNLCLLDYNYSNYYYSFNKLSQYKKYTIMSFGYTDDNIDILLPLCEEDAKEFVSILNIIDNYNMEDLLRLLKLVNGHLMPNGEPTKLYNLEQR